MRQQRRRGGGGIDDDAVGQGRGRGDAGGVAAAPAAAASTPDGSAGSGRGSAARRRRRPAQGGDQGCLVEGAVRYDEEDAAPARLGKDVAERPASGTETQSSKSAAPRRRRSVARRKRLPARGGGLPSGPAPRNGRRGPADAVPGDRPAPCARGLLARQPARRRHRCCRTRRRRAADAHPPRYGARRSLSSHRRPRLHRGRRPAQRPRLRRSRNAARPAVHALQPQARLASRFPPRLGG